MAPAWVGDLDHRCDRELADARRPLQLRRAAAGGLRPRDRDVRRRRPRAPFERMTPAAGSPPPGARSPVRVSAVIVTYNSAHCVGACLTSIVEQLQPHEIIVVDNASTDDSIEAVRRAAPSSIVIES